MTMSATTTAKPTSDKRDDNDKPTTHERVVGVIEAAAYGDKALAGHNPNDLANRERHRLERRADSHSRCP
jgi:hypothetical protein